MSNKHYFVSIHVLFDDNTEDGPIRTLSDLILPPLNEAGAPVLEFVVREIDES